MASVRTLPSDRHLVVVPEPITIRRAVPGEAQSLSDLALRSKGYWGYSQDFLDQCRAELSVSEDQIKESSFTCFVAESGGVVHGYYSTVALSPIRYELDALFVEPDQIGGGVGRALVNHAIQKLSEQGVQKLLIQGDPNAAGFYESVGAKQIGSRESESIPGRFLPLFEIAIEGSQSATD